jgi:hypothetical protein
MELGNFSLRKQTRHLQRLGRISTKVGLYKSVPKFRIFVALRAKVLLSENETGKVDILVGALCS